MVEFIHTSDWHLGNAFSAFSDPQQQALGEARFDAVARLFGYARENGVRLILCAGDQIDNGEFRDSRVLLTLFGIIGAYPEIRVVMISGNHDPLTSASVYRRVDAASYPPNLTFVWQPQAIDLEEGNARILAAPLSEKHGRRNPILDLATSHSSEGDREISVGLAHGSVELSDRMATGESFPIPADFAQKAGLDYLALGDWHSYLSVDRHTFYPGTHEPLTFGDKSGSLHVRIERPGAAPQVTRFGEPTFRWRSIQRSVEDETLDSLLSELTPTGNGEEVSRSVVRLLLEGYLSLEQFKRLEERVAIAKTQHFALLVERMPSLKPSEEEIRSVAQAGYMGRVVERLLELASEGDRTADAALLRVHEFFRPREDT